MEDVTRLSRRLSDSVTIELPGMVILVAILVFFLVVSFLLLLQLYSGWFWSRIEEPAPLSPESRGRLDFSGAQELAGSNCGKGLDSGVLRSLPVQIFHPRNFKDGLECAVCLCELVEGEKARMLPDCCHGFHIECIDMWFQSNSTCPICRNPVNPVASNSSVVCPLTETDELHLQEENGISVSSSSESPNFPLFWGGCLEEGPSRIPCPSSSSTLTANLSHPDADLEIDVQQEISFSPLEPSSSRSGDEERKLPVSTRLRSLKRLLSRERRIGPCNPTSMDVVMEQIPRGQS